MPGHLTRDTRTSAARVLGRACRLTRRYVSGEYLMTILAVLVSALHPEPGSRPARAVASCSPCNGRISISRLAR